MKTSKVLLGSFVLAGLFSACTNEEIVEVAQNDAALAERAQINLSFNAPVDSRMGINSDGIPVFEKHDVLGAVLVDKGYSPTGWKNVDWGFSEGHVGNNKWAYDETKGKFTTEGTTAVGAWLFYTQYNKAMTTSRDGVKYAFPQIQEGAADLSWAENHNINFKITPVLRIDGYEGENLDLSLMYASVYNYLDLKFKFVDEEVTSVQKILVNAEKAGAPYEFPAMYKIDNDQVPVADLSLDPLSPNYVGELTGDVPVNVNLADQNQAIVNAYYKIREREVNAMGEGVDQVNWANAITPLTIGVKEGTKTYPYLVVDCDANHTNNAVENVGMPVTNGKFETYMLMPAGLYESITLTIYTNNGIYEKTVEYRDLYQENIPTATPGVFKTPSKGNGEIYLRHNVVTSLSNVEGIELNDDVDYLKIEKKSLAVEDVITKTQDLINFISGIQTHGNHIVNVIAQDEINGGTEEEVIPEHAVIVNQDVMNAVEAKETELGKDIQLIFQGASIKIYGNTKAEGRLDVHDMTFNEGCTVENGYVKATSDIVIPNTKSIITLDGTNVQLSLVDESIYRLQINEGSKVTVSKAATISAVSNKGSLTIKKAFNGAYFTNTGTVTVDVDGVVTYDNFANGTVDQEATFVNKGVVNAKTLTNNSTWTNNNLVNVLGTVTNKADLTIAAGAQVIVNSKSAGTLSNSVGATIINNGELYTTLDGTNVIDNLGTIEANEGSRTWITTNSSANEKSTFTENVTMGTVKVAKRNTNAVVTTDTQQGYIEYTVAAEDLVEGTLTAVEGDIFNKVIVSSTTKLAPEASYINFIEASANVSLPEGARIQELEFTANAYLYTKPATDDKAKRVLVSKLTVNEGVTLDIPSGNALYVYTQSTYIPYSATSAAIHNVGRIMLGGVLYTSLTQIEAEATSTGGVFGSGHGVDTAYRWAKPW